MKVLVISVEGQLGHDVVNELGKRGHMAVGVNIEEMGITGVTSVERVITEADVEAAIYCVAYTAVDATGDNVDMCRRVNTGDAENVARVCEKLDVKMIYISANYVFNGQSTRAWEPDDERELLNVHGPTKCEGELVVERHLSKYFIVRIARVFGINGKNFIRTMLNLGKTHDSITAVGGQIGSPTYTYDLAKLLVDVIETKCYGRYHATNKGLCSWYEFTCEIFKQAGMKMAVLPVDFANYPSKTERSMNSHTSKGKLKENGFERPPSQ